MSVEEVKARSVDAAVFVLEYWPYAFEIVADALLDAWVLMLVVGAIHAMEPEVPAISFFACLLVRLVFVPGKIRSRIRHHRSEP